MSFLDSCKAFVSYVMEFQIPGSTEEIKHETSLLELQGFVRELEQENEVLKERLGAKRTILLSDNGAYFFETSDGREEPFCSRCWDLDCKLVRLGMANDGVPTCPQCKKSFS
ncbi:MAG: hypothetical protein IMF18_03975 [Proteobacteria bacterium]|nr:hypothetical protein [Pseudomonadota bacterium]